MWKCDKCGALHDNRGNHQYCMAVIIPPMEDGGCGYDCPFIRHDDSGEWCWLDIAQGVEWDGDKVIKCRPGLECPRYEKALEGK